MVLNSEHTERSHQLRFAQNDELSGEVEEAEKHEAKVEQDVPDRQLACLLPCGHVDQAGQHQGVGQPAHRTEEPAAQQTDARTADRCKTSRQV